MHFIVIVTVTQEVDSKVGKPRPREQRDRPAKDRASIESGPLQRPCVLGDGPGPRPEPARAGLHNVHGTEGEKSELVQTNAVLAPFPSDHSARPFHPAPAWGRWEEGTPFPG